MHAYTTSVAVGTTATQILSADDSRDTVIISCPTANRVTVSDRPDVSDLNGVVLYAAGMSVQINYADFGEWVCKNLYAISNSGTNTIGILASTGCE